MATHISFPDIGQFRNLIKNIKDHTRWSGTDANGDPIFEKNVDLPTLKYTGHIKLHGSNGCIAIDPKSGEFWLQTRERICSVQDDNAGFARFFAEIINLNSDFLNTFVSSLVNESKDTIFIYGEWCGKGIQKNVAIAELPKMFVIINVRVGNQWIPLNRWKDLKAPEHSIYNIQDYKKYQLTIDFEHPELVQNEIVKIVEEVEKECPVGKAFGVSGIGEGVVWIPEDEQYQDGKFWMKTKGEKHSVSKVTTLASIDVEKVANINEFVANTVTEARCQQSITKLKESNKAIDRTSIGEFIRWIFNDIVKEETDTAVASNIEISKIGGPISNAAKKWFFNNEDKFDN